MPLYIRENENIKSTIHRTIMSMGRLCRGSYCFRESVHSNCKSLGWDTPRQMIIKQSDTMFKKIMYKNEPKQISEKIRQPWTRTTAKLGKKLGGNLVFIKVLTYITA